jgi:hypothetical protein
MVFMLVVLSCGMVLRTTTHRERLIPSFGSGACPKDRRSNSITMPEDLPDPTGPRITRIRWSLCMNLARVGGAV